MKKISARPKNKIKSRRPRDVNPTSNGSNVSLIKFIFKYAGISVEKGKIHSIIRDNLSSHYLMIQ